MKNSWLTDYSRRHLIACCLALAVIVGCTQGRSWLHEIPRRLELTPTLSIGNRSRPLELLPAISPEQAVPTVDVSPPLTLVGRLRCNPGNWVEIGKSVANRPLEAIWIGGGGQPVLLIGGIHGDEPEGLPVTEWFAEELRANSDLTRQSTVVIVRNLNPDGASSGRRVNQTGVDLNRNFPATNWDPVSKTARFNPGTKPASEPETQVAVQLILEFKPVRVLVMHATTGRPMNNYDGPGKALAQSLSRFNKYVVSDSIGYPTPGSLGSWVGNDLGTPIITLELPRKISAENAWAANKLALIEMLKFEGSQQSD